MKDLSQTAKVYPYCIRITPDALGTYYAVNYAGKISLGLADRYM